MAAIALVAAALLLQPSPVLSEGGPRRLRPPGSPAPAWSAGGSLMASRIEASTGRGSERKGSSNPASALMGDVGSTSESSGSAGGLTERWRALRQTSIGKRVFEVGYWIAGAFRLLWSIPKAIIEGDSRSLIEAIGDLLSGATSDSQEEEANQGRPEPGIRDSGIDEVLPGGEETVPASPPLR